MIDSDGCSLCRERLPWYAAGTLHEAEHSEVERHVRTCIACAHELAEWQALGNDVLAAGQATEPIPALAASWETFSARLATLLAPVAMPEVSENSEWDNGAAIQPIQPMQIATPYRTEGARVTVRRFLWRLRIVLWAQVRLLRPVMWVASALAILLAAFSSYVLSQAIGHSSGATDLLAFALPLISSTGTTFLYGPENDPALELGRATPTSPRVVLLSRFALLFGFDAVLALLATLALVTVQGGGFWALTTLWLGPMALLSAVSLGLSLFLGPAVSVGVVALFWLANSVNISNGVQWQPGWLIAGWNTGLLMILALVMLVIAALLASRQERLPAGASDAFSSLENSSSGETPTLASDGSLHPENQDAQRQEDRHMRQLVALGGVIRYEFLMQIRRISLWIISALLGALSLIQFTNTHNYTHDANMLVTRTNIVVIEAAGAAGFFWLGAGLLLAGRVRRDYTTKMDEILGATPATMLTRLFGKYVGSVLATFIPMMLIYLVGVTLLAANWHDFSIFPLALAGFLALVVPTVLFVGAFSIACTTVIWPPLYMFLFIGYYLWDSLDPKGPIPTLDGTVLSPSGRLIMTGIFHFTPFRTTDLTYYPQTSVWGGIANIVVLLAAGAIALLAAWGLEVWRVRRA